MLGHLPRNVPSANGVADFHRLVMQREHAYRVPSSQPQPSDRTNGPILTHREARVQCQQEHANANMQVAPQWSGQVVGDTVLDALAMDMQHPGERFAGRPNVCPPPPGKRRMKRTWVREWQGAEA